MSGVAYVPSNRTFTIISHTLQTHGDAWFKPSEENVAAGVCLRVAPGKFRLFPYENHYLAPFEAAIRQLNPLIAVKVRSAAVHAVLATVSDDAPAIYIDSDTRIQILDTVAHLVRADKEQCGAFIVRFFISYRSPVLIVSVIYSVMNAYLSLGRTISTTSFLSAMIFRTSL